jgi:hypothetical protein
VVARRQQATINSPRQPAPTVSVPEVKEDTTNTSPSKASPGQCVVQIYQVVKVNYDIYKH